MVPVMAKVASPNCRRDQSDGLDRLKSEFLAVLHHEIRTPLAGILGMADLLLETPLSEDQRAYVETTRTCAEDLMEHLGSALRLTELSAGIPAPEDSDFNLAEVLEFAAAACRIKAQAKGLAFSLAIDAGMPHCARGDGMRLGEILTHVLTNAVKFTAEGEIVLRAVAGAPSGGELQLTIEVRDTGIGIAPSQTQTIFESFRQGEGGISRRYPGLGLGLTVVQRLMESLNGQVKVASEPGKGSLVSLLIPLRVASETIAPSKRPKPSARVRRVLVVDDNPVSRRNLAKMLSGREYEVECVGNPEAALAELARRRYEAVLLDLHIPGLDAVETVRAIRARNGYKNVPVIALAPRVDERFRASCAEYGFQAVVDKPVQIQDLLPALQQVLP